MTDSLTGVTNYTYDALNRLTQLTGPSGQVVGFGYDALSRRTSLTFPNSTAASYTYDAASQLTDISHRSTVNGPLSAFGYTYDRVGNRTMMNTARSGVAAALTLNYSYDALYRLTQATRPLPAQPNETFNYDTVGNRLRRDGQAVDARFNAANRLQEDAEFTYQYDLNGNLTQKAQKLNGSVTRYAYDAENQLTRIDFPDGTNAQYRYDGLGRRIEKNVNGVITRYLYDSEDILLEFSGANQLAAKN